MAEFEVPEPILNSPFAEPQAHWLIREGESPRQMLGRRKAGYFFRPPERADEADPHAARGLFVELATVNLIRDRLKAWLEQGRPGITRTTRELLDYWTREGRSSRIFFAQREAAETIVFLTEARPDFLQGIDIPLDEPGEDRIAQGFRAFRRLGCKMATGSGKTTVMAMLSAWSILNKVNDRSDARFSDVVLAVCPNVTIRNRLQEIDPRNGEASIYRTRDLVPERLMADLTQGRVIVTNWHVFEPQGLQIGGASAKVNKSGVRVKIKETVTIAAKTTSMRGSRYMTREALEAMVAKGEIAVLGETRDEQGSLRKVEIEAERYVESDAALVSRVLGREVGGKQNILVLNDEAHHAYRIRNNRPDEEHDDEDEEEDEEYLVKEATVWIDGLDRINKLRGINFCVDLSATPYFIGRVGQETNKIFPWVVSDFGLTDAIESGLVKIPQLAIRDTSGAEIPGYFNIWRWVLPQLTPAERGGRKANPKPEAILKYANTPIAMLAGLWDEERRKWLEKPDDPRPPVFILVCKNTRIAKVIYDWIAEEKPPTGIPPLRIKELRNTLGKQVTIRVDTRVVHETDSDKAKSDEVAWMRATLDTVGKREWPRDSQGRPIYPEGFEELAKKLERPLHPPGRDVRCIVSVGMLTEGWDCNTVTHIVGLRPFMSQLLCEQVVGRGLRRTNYSVDENEKLDEEVAKVFGVPFEVIPFKANEGSAPVKRPKQNRVHALPDKARFEIRFPRVEGYRQAVRNRVTVDWSSIAQLRLDPRAIPPEVEMKALVPNNKGRPSLTGPGKIADVNLNPYRKGKRIQQLAFEMARDLTRSYAAQPDCTVPVHVLFPQLVAIVERYLAEKVVPESPAEKLDLFLAPYYGWAIERLTEAIRPDATQDEVPELPVLERSRPDGSTGDADFWTSREVREVIHSHLNFVVADTQQWEQSAAYQIDRHKGVDAFAKNSGLGFAIPYFHNGQPHDYEPDFLIRLKGEGPRMVILETKGYDKTAEIKAQAAARWVAAVNADGRYGHWQYVMVRNLKDVTVKLNEIAAEAMPA